jgi:hypothetical protein
MKRSRCVIRNFIELGKDYGEKRFHGAKPKLKLSTTGDKQTLPAVVEVSGQ